MSAWTDARDNIRVAIVSAWNSMSPEHRAYCTGLAVGLVLGAVGMALAL